MRVYLLSLISTMGISLFAADGVGKPNLMPNENLAIECPLKLDAFKKITEIPSIFLGDWQSQDQKTRKFVIEKNAIHNVDSARNRKTEDLIIQIYLVSESQIILQLDWQTIRVLRSFDDGIVSNKFTDGKTVSTIAFKKIQ